MGFGDRTLVSGLSQSRVLPTENRSPFSTCSLLGNHPRLASQAPAAAATSQALRHRGRHDGPRAQDHPAVSQHLCPLAPGEVMYCSSSFRGHAQHPQSDPQIAEGEFLRRSFDPGLEQQLGFAFHSRAVLSKKPSPVRPWLSLPGTLTCSA